MEKSADKIGGFHLYKGQSRKSYLFLPFISVAFVLR